MQLTEAEARHKWCPVVRVDGGNRVHNTMSDGFTNSDSSYRCIGSDCMAWRRYEITRAHGQTSNEHRGYCGLAGKPTNLG